MWLAAEPALPDIAPILNYVLNYGVLGLVLLAAVFGFVQFKPAVERLLAAKDEVLAAKDQQISQLQAERDRAIAERDEAEEQRDAALAVSQDKIVPLLTEFVGTTQALLPLMQMRIMEDRDDRRR